MFRPISLVSLLVIVFVAVASPAVAQSNDIGESQIEGFEWHLEEPLTTTMLTEIDKLMAFYRNHDMDYDARMLQRTLDGELNESELEMIKANGNLLLGTVAYDHYYDPGSGAHLYTWIERVWWYPNYNLHYANSSTTMASMYMRVRAWDSGGAILYDNYFGFPVATDLYARNPGGSSGTARSDGEYSNGVYTIYRTASGGY